MVEKRKNKLLQASVIVVAISFMATTVAAIAGKDNPIYYDPTEIQLQFSFAEPTITPVMISSETYDRVAMENVPSGGNTGIPMLPIKPVSVLLPQRGEVSSITITTAGNTSLGTGFHVEIGGTPTRPGSTPEDQPTELHFNPTIAYPTTLYHIVDTQQYRGYTLLLVNLFPVHYIYATGEIYYYQEMSINIVATDTGDRDEFYRGIYQDEVLMKQKVDDFRMLSEYLFPPEPLSASNSLVNPADSYEYVIITVNALKTAFEEFKMFKLQHGVRTTIVTVEDILSCSAYRWDGAFGDGNQFFSDLQCKIRNFIKDAYMNWETQYILLGGDDNLIPHRGFYCFVPDVFSAIDYDIPADMYYSCLDGDFNKNRNDKWAEVKDKPDLQAEVAVGRACVSDATEVANFITKTRGYEESQDPYR